MQALRRPAKKDEGDAKEKEVDAKAVFDHAFAEHEKSQDVLAKELGAFFCLFASLIGLTLNPIPYFVLFVVKCRIETNGSGAESGGADRNSRLGDQWGRAGGVREPKVSRKGEQTVERESAEV